MLLHVLLMIRYPLSPALRAFEFVRWFLGLVLRGLEDPDYVAELSEGGEALLKLDRWLSILEKLLHAITGRLAADQLGLRFKSKRPSLGLMPRSTPGKPLTFPEVSARFRRLARMLGDIERLARRRASRIAREIEANPLNLTDTTGSAAAAAAAAAAADSTSILSAAAAAVFRKMTDRGVSVRSHPSFLRIRAPP